MRHQRTPAPTSSFLNLRDNPALYVFYLGHLFDLTPASLFALRTPLLIKGTVQFNNRDEEQATAELIAEEIRSLREVRERRVKRLEVKLEDGETLNLGPGDLVSFTKGTNSTWTVKTPFKKFFIVSG